MTQLDEAVRRPQQGECPLDRRSRPETGVEHDPVRRDPGGPGLPRPARPGRPARRPPPRRARPGPEAPCPATTVAPHSATTARYVPSARPFRSFAITAPAPNAARATADPGRGDRQRHVDPGGHRPTARDHLDLLVHAPVGPCPPPRGRAGRRPRRRGRRPAGPGRRATWSAPAPGSTHVEDAHHDRPVLDVDVPVPEPEGGGRARTVDATGGAGPRSPDGPSRPGVRTAGRTATCGTAACGGRQPPASRAGPGTPGGRRGRP